MCGFGQVDTIYTGFTNAFVLVIYRLLLRKLQLIGSDGCALDWLCFYWPHSSCSYWIRNFTANLCLFWCSTTTPYQPALPLIFINDFTEKLSGSHFLLYADDLKMYHPIRNKNEEGALRFQNDLVKVQRWSKVIIKETIRDIFRKVWRFILRLIMKIADTQNATLLWTFFSKSYFFIF